MKSNRTPFFSTPCLLGPLLLATNLMMFSLAGSADAQGNTKRGATVGGLAGAVAGAAIGDHNGEAGACAAIGGIIGAFAGGLLGNAEDQKQAYEMQNFYQQNQNRWSQYRKSAVSCEDVVAMKNSGLSDQVIINQIQQRGVQRQLQVPEIIALHRQGVSDRGHHQHAARSDRVKSSEQKKFAAASSTGSLTDSSANHDSHQQLPPDSRLSSTAILLPKGANPPSLPWVSKRNSYSFLARAVWFQKSLNNTNGAMN